MSISVYWISTALLCLLYLASACMYLAKGEFVRKAQAELGYSAPLLVPWMIVIKILGPVAIVWRFNTALSDLAYAGMFYHLLLSGMAHLGIRKPKGAIPAALGLLFLFASFGTQNAARQPPSPYAPAATAIGSRGVIDGRPARTAANHHRAAAMQRITAAPINRYPAHATTHTQS